jgi:hypothetical protein
MRKIFVISIIFNSTICCNNTSVAQNTTISPDKLTTKTLQIIENASNGKILMSDDTGNANWTDISKFRVGFSVYAKNNQNYPADFPKPILFEVETFDTNNNFENSTFTVKDAEIYYFGTNLSWQATIYSGTNWHGVVVELKVKDVNNTVKTVASSTLPLTTNLITTQQFTSIINLNVGDKVSLTIASLGSTASLLNLVTDNLGSYFYGYRVL